MVVLWHLGLNVLLKIAKKQSEFFFKSKVVYKPGSGDYDRNRLIAETFRGRKLQ